MQQNVKYVTVTETPKWACNAMGFVGLALAVISTVYCAFNFQLLGSPLNITAAVFYLILALALFCASAMLFSSGRSGEKWPPSFSFLIGNLWCSLSTIICILNGAIYLTSRDTTYFVFGIVYIVLGIFYLLCAIFLGISSYNVRKEKRAIVTGAIGSISLASIATTNFVSACISVDVLTIIACLIIAFMAALLIIISFGTRTSNVAVAREGSRIVYQDLRKKRNARPATNNPRIGNGEFSNSVSPSYATPISKPESVEPRISEREKIELLKEYKELLDSGAITQQDYDKKKSKLLD